MGPAVTSIMGLTEERPETQLSRYTISHAISKIIYFYLENIKTAFLHDMALSVIEASPNSRLNF